MAAVLAGCTQEAPPITVRNLDRPSEVGFACFGGLRINDGDPAAAGRVETSAQPMASCVAHAAGVPPAGQEQREGETLATPQLYGFVLQPARGTVAVVDNQSQTVLDSDPLTPGKNSIPIGTLPVGIVPDSSGCFMVTANAGSCDLTSLDATATLNAALFLRGAARISRTAVVNQAGDRLRAKPRSITAGDPTDTVGFECPARPSGLVYVSYPACHLVAAIDAESGEVIAGLEFEEDGSVTITDGNVSCPSECGDGSIVAAGGEGDIFPAGGVDAGLADAGPDPDGGPVGPPSIDDTAPRPVVVKRGSDGRLYIGSENSPILTWVELDDAGLPISVDQVQLDGAVGVTSLAVSDVIEMGGDTGVLDGTAGAFRFVYAVTTDRTVRVVDIGGKVECDTQVDSRFLYGERDVQKLSCLPVGDPARPPRRPSARSPGIHFPRRSTPLDVAFAQVSPPSRPAVVSPLEMVGYFAFVSTSDGFVYVVNVDDDNYADFEDAGDPARANMSLAAAHQVRDFVRVRDAVPTACGYPQAEPLDLPPRVSEAPLIGFNEDLVAAEKLGLMPTLGQVLCTAGETPEPVSELGFAAPTEVREQAFADWLSVQNENVSVAWEGELSRDTSSVNLDGPAVRVGRVEASGGTGLLRDPAAPFCQIGVEEFDAAVLVGCDPAQGNSQCGLGESCFVHPDQPTAVTSGVCLPAAQADALSGPCREFLVTRRSFSVRRVHADRLELGVRRRVLRTTPVGGCDADAQCRQLAQVVPLLGDPDHPRDIEVEEDTRPWVCAADPSRAPGQDRCQLSCQTSADCDPGDSCQGGFCVEGALPPGECLAALQRYQIRASGAFVVIGDRTGYLHNRIRDPDTGECVADPDASPLLVGRIPLEAPPCSGDGFTDLSPNPCSTTFRQTDRFTPFEEAGGRCSPRAQEVRTRDASAIRFINPFMRMHLVDPTTTGDLVCTGDRAGGLPPFSPVYPGFQFQFTLVGGFFPMFATLIEASFPHRIAPAPDGRLWVLDQGDDASANTQGRIFTMFPGAASDAFAVTPIF